MDLIWDLKQGKKIPLLKTHGSQTGSGHVMLEELGSPGQNGEEKAAQRMTCLPVNNRGSELKKPSFLIHHFFPFSVTSGEVRRD